MMNPRHLLTVLSMVSYSLRVHTVVHKTEYVQLQRFLNIMHPRNEIRQVVCLYLQIYILVR